MPHAFAALSTVGCYEALRDGPLALSPGGAPATLVSCVSDQLTQSVSFHAFENPADGTL